MGLEPNKKYQFRVRAENQYGVSEPLTLDDPITAKVIFKSNKTFLNYEIYFNFIILNLSVLVHCT